MLVLWMALRELPDYAYEAITINLGCRLMYAEGASLCADGHDTTNNSLHDNDPTETWQSWSAR